MVIRQNQQQHNSSYGFQSYRGGANAVATDRIRCSMGEWKQRNQFSNKALSTYDFMTKSGRATAKDPLITCREHTSSGQRTELLCQGPCGRVRGANDFSKASKRNKKLWCKDCTDWHTADPDYNLPPPGTELSIDELDRTKKGAQVPNEREEVQSNFNSNTSSVHGSSRDDDEDYETTNTSETADSQSSTFASDDDDEDDVDDDDDDDLTSGYFSDGSDGTIHAGLGSISPQTAKGLELLTTYTHSAQSQTASSASQPDTGSDGLSTLATSTKATSNATTERVRSNGWVRERKPKTFQAPNYIRHGGVPREQENRRLRGEDSDDSF